MTGCRARAPSSSRWPTPRRTPSSSWPSCSAPWASASWPPRARTAPWPSTASTPSRCSSTPVGMEMRGEPQAAPGRRRRAEPITTVVDLIEAGEIDLVINIPRGRGARSDGYEIRRAALRQGVPTMTNAAAAHAAVQAIANDHKRREITRGLPAGPAHPAGRHRQRPARRRRPQRVTAPASSASAAGGRRGLRRRVRAPLAGHGRREPAARQPVRGSPWRCPAGPARGPGSSPCCRPRTRAASWAGRSRSPSRTGRRVSFLIAPVGDGHPRAVRPRARATASGCWVRWATASTWTRSTAGPGRHGASSAAGWGRLRSRCCSRGAGRPRGAASRRPLRRASGSARCWCCSASATRPRRRAAGPVAGGGRGAARGWACRCPGEVATEDGSLGRAGEGHRPCWRAAASGRPAGRLRALGHVARPWHASARRSPDVQAWFSLETGMACGVGSCHGCVVPLADGAHGPGVPRGAGVRRRGGVRPRAARRGREGGGVSVVRPARAAPVPPDLSVQLGPLRLAHPLINASGTMEIFELAEVARPGDPRRPAGGRLRAQDDHAGARARATAPPRILETAGGMINAIGLPGEGLEAFVARAPAPAAGASLPADPEHRRLLARGVRRAGRRAPRRRWRHAWGGGWTARVGSGAEHLLSQRALAAASPSAATRGRRRRWSAAVREVWPGLLVVKLTPNVTDIARHRPGGRGGGRRRPRGGQHLQGAGASTGSTLQALPGQHHRRPVGPGHQAAGAARRLRAVRDASTCPSSAWEAWPTRPGRARLHGLRGHGWWRWARRRSAIPAARPRLWRASWRAALAGAGLTLERAWSGGRIARPS